MNIPILLATAMGLLSPPVNEKTVAKSAEASINSIILINGQPTVASISKEAEVLSIHGTAPSYFQSEESELDIIYRTIASQAADYGLISDRSFIIQDTSDIDIFSEAQVDALREVVIDYENSLHQAQIILKHNDTREDSELALNIRSVLLDFGVDITAITVTKDTTSHLDNFGVQVNLISKSTAGL